MLEGSRVADGARSGLVLMGVSAQDENGHVFNLQTTEITIDPAITLTWNTTALSPAVAGQPYTMAVPVLVETHSDVLYRPQRIDANSNTAASTLPPSAMRSSSTSSAALQSRPSLLLSCRSP